MIWVAIGLSSLSLVLWAILVVDHAKLDARVEKLETDIIGRVRRFLEEQKAKEKS